VRVCVCVCVCVSGGDGVEGNREGVCVCGGDAEVTFR